MTVQELNTIFGNNIKKYRKMRAWSQAVLAEKIALSVNSVCEIETGKNFAKPETLLNLSSVFNVEVYEFFKPKDVLPDKAETILSDYSEDVKEAMDKIRKKYYRKMKKG